eukprot:Blabericola_migrator_1__5762@NODE_291_length_10277_cov_142_043193_g239_i0_p7_GENE_NODE_291_length_10277_cov_142_043193_g239_i0NODE_291_length_10277_cov_142_043193_g239_i0_p7_ORF_typecomplete_len111_score16_91Evr1_Alr/PF04777_13/0_18_NODE_291_length_10277_cov_142_043193_g239_i033883720
MISQRRLELGFGGRDQPFVERKWMMLYSYAARIDYEKSVNNVDDSVYQAFFNSFPGLQQTLKTLPPISTKSSRTALLCLLVAHNEERKRMNLPPIYETPSTLIREFVGPS